MIISMLLALVIIWPLVTTGALWWYVVRTLRERPISPSQLLAEWSEVQLEWTSTLDMLSKQLKKLSKRERDAVRASGADEPTPITGKDQIRALARQRGMIR